MEDVIIKKSWGSIKKGKNNFLIQPFELTGAHFQYLINNRLNINNNKISFSSLPILSLSKTKRQMNLRSMNRRKISVKSYEKSNNKLKIKFNDDRERDIDLDYLKPFENMGETKFSSDLHTINSLFSNKGYHPFLIKEEITPNIILLGYPDINEMKQIFIKSSSEYFYQSKEFQDVLKKQRALKPFNKDLFIKSRYFGYSKEIDFLKKLPDFNYPLFEQKAFEYLRNEYENTSQRILTKISYNFHILTNKDGKLKPLIYRFNELTPSHTSLLSQVEEIIYRKMSNLPFLETVKEQEEFYNNYFIYIKANSYFNIHCEYVNPFQNLQKAFYQYKNVIYFKDLICYSEMFRENGEPFLKNFFPETMERQDLYLEPKSASNQKGGYINTSLLRNPKIDVIMFNYSSDKKSIEIILKNESQFYKLIIGIDMEMQKNQIINLINRFKYDMNNCIYYSEDKEIYYLKSNIEIFYIKELSKIDEYDILEKITVNGLSINEVITNKEFKEIKAQNNTIFGINPIKYFGDFSLGNTPDFKFIENIQIGDYPYFMNVTKSKEGEFIGWILPNQYLNNSYVKIGEKQGNPIYNYVDVNFNQQKMLKEYYEIALKNIQKIDKSIKHVNLHKFSALQYYIFHFHFLKEETHKFVEKKDMFLKSVTRNLDIYPTCPLFTAVNYGEKINMNLFSFSRPNLFKILKYNMQEQKGGNKNEININFETIRYCLHNRLISGIKYRNIELIPSSKKYYDKLFFNLDKLKNFTKYLKQYNFRNIGTFIRPKTINFISNELKNKKLLVFDYMDTNKDYEMYKLDYGCINVFNPDLKKLEENYDFYEIKIYPCFYYDINRFRDVNLNVLIYYLPLIFNSMRKGSNFFVAFQTLLIDNKFIRILNALIDSFEELEIMDMEYYKDFTNTKLLLFKNYRGHNLFPIINEKFDFTCNPPKYFNFSYRQEPNELLKPILKTKEYCIKYINTLVNALFTPEFNYEKADKFFSQKYLSFVKETVLTLKKYKYSYPIKFNKIIEKYDKTVISQLFSITNPLKFKLIKDTNSNTIMRRSKRTSDVIKFERFFEIQEEEKDIRRFNRQYYPKDFDLANKLLEDTDHGLSKYIRNVYGAKISNAFLKAWEILQSFPFSFKKDKDFKTFHFAELPGNIIASIKKYNNGKLDYLAESLNPNNPENIKKYGKDIFNDKEYGYMKAEPERWKFGSRPNDTGDITDPRIILYFRKINQERKPKLVTGDAGLETSHSLLLLQKLDFAQALMAIGNSVKGTDIFVKHFTPFINQIKESKQASPFFISLIELYKKYYEKVYLFKPLTSNSGSGEFYLIGLNAKPIEDAKFNYYLKKLQNFKTNDIITSYSNSTLIQCYDFLQRLLIDIGLRRIRLFNYVITFSNEIKKHKKELEKVKINKYKEWIDEYDFTIDKQLRNFT